MGKPYFMDQIFSDKTFLGFSRNEDKAYFAKGDTRELYTLNRFSDQQKQKEYEQKKAGTDLFQWILVGGITFFATLMRIGLDSIASFEILRAVGLAWMLAALICGVIYTRHHFAKALSVFSEAAQTDDLTLVQDQEREKFLKDTRIRLRGQLIINLLVLAGIGCGVYTALMGTLTALFLLGLASAFLAPHLWRDIRALGTQMKVLNQLLGK